MSSTIRAPDKFSLLTDKAKDHYSKLFIKHVLLYLIAQDRKNLAFEEPTEFNIGRALAGVSKISTYVGFMNAITRTLFGISDEHKFYWSAAVQTEGNRILELTDGT